MNIEEIEAEVTRLEEALDQARDALRRARIAEADARPEEMRMVRPTVLHLWYT